MRNRRKIYKRLIGFIFFLLCFFIFSMTLSSRFYGYERNTLRSFRNIIYHGDFSSQTPAGTIDILSFLPLEWVNWAFINPGDFPLRNLISLFTLPLMSAMICLLFYLILLELFDSVETALQTSLLFAFTTMIFPYSKIGMEIQHTLWSTALLWTFILWKKRGSASFLVLSGLCAGLILHTKVYGFVMTGAASLYVLGDVLILSKEKKNVRRSLVSFFTPIIGFLFLMAIMNKMRFGSLFLGSRYNLGYEAKRIPVWQGLFGFLFSSGKSVFIYNPLLIASVFFTPRFLRRFGYLKPLLILVFVSGLAFHSLLWIWTDETWGPRKLHYLIPFAFLPLGLALERFRSLSFHKRLAFILLTLSGIFVQVLGVSFSYEAHCVILRWRGLSSMENLRYNPRLSHTTINYALLGSTIDKYLTGEAHYLIYKPSYLETVKPLHPVKRVGVSMQTFSSFDFWFLDNSPQRGGRFFLRPFARRYFSLLLLLTPFLFFLLYILCLRVMREKDSWIKRSPGWVLLLLSFFGLFLCLAYNRAYSKDLKNFIDNVPESQSIFIGNDPFDENFLGHGWRDSEWMNDPENPIYQIPFRWTNSERSYISLPVKPYTPYKFTMKVIFVYPTRLSAFVNGYCVGYVKGRRNENKTVSLSIPRRVIGPAPVCELIIHHHALHVPAKENPEHSTDLSTLGVIIYEVLWEKGVQ